MGKGGTKFVGEAVNVRSGRKRTTYTGKELKKDMEKFLETGVHPHMQRTAAEAAAGVGRGVLVPLPDPDPGRPHVFLDVSVDNKPAGRLVVELYEDVAPAGARHLLNRCLPGSSASVQGAAFHKLLPGYGIFCGKSSGAMLPGAHELPRNARLQHNVTGAVSVARDGSDFAISLGKAMALDDTHQVVGRVTMGLDVLQLIGDVPRGPDDSPLMRLRVAKCGATNAQGTHESLEESLAKETPEAAAARLKQESADTRTAVMEALQQGMSRKRTADDAGLGPGSSAAAAAAAGAGAAPAGAAGAGAGTSSRATAAAGAPSKPAAAGAGAPGPSKRSKNLLDSLLDDVCSDDSGDGSTGSGSGEEEG